MFFSSRTASSSLLVSPKQESESIVSTESTQTGQLKIRWNVMAVSDYFVLLRFPACTRVCYEPHNVLRGKKKTPLWFSEQGDRGMTGRVRDSSWLCQQNKKTKQRQSREQREAETERQRDKRLPGSGSNGVYAHSRRLKKKRMPVSNYTAASVLLQ